MCWIRLRDGVVLANERASHHAHAPKEEPVVCLCIHSQEVDRYVATRMMSALELG